MKKLFSRRLFTRGVRLSYQSVLLITVLGIVLNASYSIVALQEAGSRLLSVENSFGICHYIMVILAFALAINLYGYHLSSKAAVYMTTIPYTRSCIYVTYFVLGFLYMIAFILLCLVPPVLLAVFGSQFTVSVAMLFKGAGTLLMIGLMVYLATQLALFVTGKMRFSILFLVGVLTFVGYTSVLLTVLFRNSEWQEYVRSNLLCSLFFEQTQEYPFFTLLVKMEKMIAILWNYPVYNFLVLALLIIVSYLAIRHERIEYCGQPEISKAAFGFSAIMLSMIPLLVAQPSLQSLQNNRDFTEFRFLLYSFNNFLAVVFICKKNKKVSVLEGLT